MSAAASASGCYLTCECRRNVPKMSSSLRFFLASFKTFLASLAAALIAAFSEAMADFLLTQSGGAERVENMRVWARKLYANNIFK